MNRRELLTMAATSSWLSGCTAAVKGAESFGMPGIGIVVEESLAPGAAVKEGIQGISDTGRQMFASARLNSRNSSTSSYGAATIPRWVRVTWREGTTPGERWTTGQVIGDYTVPVLERIPKEAFELAKSGRKQPLVLRFRIRDDGVDFGWMVRLQDGAPFKVLMRGGDF